MALRKNKAFALLSVIVAATVFGVLVFSVAASEDVTVEEEETAPVFCGFRNRWLDTLTDDQLATLKEMIEENRAEVKDQLDEWGVEISELNDEQREILKTMIDENRAEVKEQLEEWGVEIPMWQGPMGLLGSLTDEQKEELQAMRQDYLDSVNAKLEEWGIEIPEAHGLPPGGMVHGPRPGGMGFRGRGVRGFGLFKP
jgi:uncharacterized protein YnzC (UPF0291/DUF896 family)